MLARQPTKLLHFSAAHAVEDFSTACKSNIHRSIRRQIPLDLSDLIKDFKSQCMVGQLHKALHLLQRLEEQGYQRRSYTYVCLLQGCIESNALHEGRLLHSYLVKEGLHANIFLSTSLANMYARCGNIEDSQSVFFSMSERNLVTWSMMISAYCTHEKFDEALHVFWRMQKDGIVPDQVNFVGALKACAGLGSLQEGQKIHELLKSSDVKLSILLGNSLMNMYVKCGSIEDAQKVFDAMEEYDAGSWSVMIAGYTKVGKAEHAMALFSTMQSTNVKPDDVTFLTILNACAVLADLTQAREVHSYIKKSGVHLRKNIWNTVIDMYAKCGSLTEAWELFDDIGERDVVTWNAMIAGLTKHGQCEVALRLHGQMIVEGIFRDEVSFVSVLNACTALEDLACGKRFHSQIAKTKAFINVFVENALIDMYAKCGSLTTARLLFEEMRGRNVVSWNSMIVGYGTHGLDENLLELFEKMLDQGMKPDEVTYVRVLNACANKSALEQGLQLHNDILKRRFECDLYVGNALIDMYSKCGRIKDAWNVLNRMLERDVVSWNALLAGYSQHGLGPEALELVESMLDEGMALNHVSFVGILSACSHAGLVNEACFFFSFMDQVHGVPQAIEHYGCMIDLLGRSGHLLEAAGLLKEMPLEKSSVLWRALLGACRIHGNMSLGAHAAERVLDMDPDDGAALLLLSNIHASVDGCEDQATMITLMNDGDIEEIELESAFAYG